MVRAVVKSRVQAVILVAGQAVEKQHEHGELHEREHPIHIQCNLDVYTMNIVLLLSLVTLSAWLHVKNSLLHVCNGIIHLYYELQRYLPLNINSSKVLTWIEMVSGLIIELFTVTRDGQRSGRITFTAFVHLVTSNIH